MPAGYDSDDQMSDSADEKVISVIKHKDDNNLLPNSRGPTAGDTIIRIPGNYDRKGNIKPRAGVSPMNRLHSGPSTTAYQHMEPYRQQKKRVSEERDWFGMNDNGPPPPKKQDLSKGRHNRSVEMIDVGQDDKNLSPQYTSRHITGAKKSDNLKQSLAGGHGSPRDGIFTTPPTETSLDQFYNIPNSKLEEYYARRRPQPPGKVKREMRLGDDSDEDDALEVTDAPKEAKIPFRRKTRRIDNDLPPTDFKRTKLISLPLEYARRGRVVVSKPEKPDDRELSLVILPEGDIQVHQDGSDLGIFNISSKEFDQVEVAEDIFFHIRLDRMRNDIPNGQFIFWRLETPCTEFGKTILKDKRVTKRLTNFIRNKEIDFYDLQDDHVAKRNGNFTSPAHKPSDIVTKPYGRDLRELRATRGRNAEVAKESKPISAQDFDVSHSTPPSRVQPTRRVEDLEPEEEMPPLVWPPKAKKRVTVEHQDLYRLHEDNFLNDNIINFYLRYLEEELLRENPALAQKTHFFNTFFYERLSQKAADKRANIESLMKWTARVDLFSKDFIIIPINENAHWYLALICNINHLESRMQANAASGEITPAEGNPVIDPHIDINPAVETVADDAEPPMVHANLQRPTTAEEQILSEAYIIETEQPPEHMDISQASGGDDIENEWPNEDGLEGSSRHPVLEFNQKDSQETDAVMVESSIHFVEDSQDKPAKNPKRSIAKARRSLKPVEQDAPTIFILDSLGVTAHGNTFTLLRAYLEEEARQKKQWDISGKRDIGGIYAKVPKQPNFVDCGVFLLYYVERFLQRPEAFTQEFLHREVTDDQFHSEEFSGMRKRLKILILQLRREQETGILQPSATNGAVAAGSSKFKCEETEYAKPIKENGILQHRGSPCHTPQRILDEQQEGDSSSKHFSVEISRSPEETKKEYQQVVNSPESLHSSSSASRSSSLVPCEQSKFRPESRPSLPTEAYSRSPSLSHVTFTSKARTQVRTLGDSLRDL